MRHMPLGALRNKKTGTAEFRHAAEKVCAALMRKMRTILRRESVKTKNVAAVIILRAALAFLPTALRVFPDIPFGFFGMKRNARTMRVKRYYENLPPLSKYGAVVIFDPILATGMSAEAAVVRLLKRGANPENIYFVGIVAAPEGLKRLLKHIPREHVILAAVDAGLDANKMIKPGIGDFGDRFFGYGDAMRK